MPKGRRPRGVTPRPRSGAVAESARLRQRGNGQEELPRVQGQGWRREELPRVRGQGWWPGGDTPLPKPEAKGGGQKELPHAPTPKAHIQEALAAQVQEGLEELSHIEGQEGQQ